MTKEEIIEMAKQCELVAGNAEHGIYLMDLQRFAALVAEKEREAEEPKKLFGYEIWNCFYRTKEELLENFVGKGLDMLEVNADGTPIGKVCNGYSKEWIEANIREVYVHGTAAIDKR